MCANGARIVGHAEVAEGWGFEEMPTNKPGEESPLTEIRSRTRVGSKTVRLQENTGAGLPKTAQSRESVPPRLAPVTVGPVILWDDLKDEMPGGSGTP